MTVRSRPPIRATAQRRGTDRSWIRALLVVLGVHTVLSLVTPRSAWVTATFMGTSELLLTGYCFARAYDESPPMRLRWLLLAATFLLWAAAFADILVVELAGQAGLTRAQPYTLLFMLRGVPLLVLLGQTDDPQGAAGTRWIDMSQSLLLGVVLAILVFPSLVSSSQVGVHLLSERLVLSYHDIENAALAVLALLSVLLQQSRHEQAFFRSIAWLLISYLIVSLVVNHLFIPGLASLPGSPLLLLTQLPNLIFLLLAVRARPGSDRTGLAARPRLRDAALIEAGRLLSPTFMAMATLSACFLIGRRTFVLGFGGGLLALLLFGARCTIIQLAYRRGRRELIAARDHLQVLSQQDPLTGLANRRRFDTALEAAWRHTSGGRGAGAASLAVLLIDLDFFKQLNDTAGHLAGDDALQRVAAAMRRPVGPDGLLARYAGDEFIVLLPDADLQRAHRVAARLAEAIAALAWPHPGSPHGVVTLSIGVAACTPDENSRPQDLLIRADRALYEAKASGRNQSVQA